jgi:hypothetical protein
LPEKALTEENLQVAMKRDETLSPSLFTFHLRFAAIRRNEYYAFIAARVYLKPAEEGRGYPTIRQSTSER